MFRVELAPCLEANFIDKKSNYTRTIFMLMWHINKVPRVSKFQSKTVSKETRFVSASPWAD